MASPPSQLRGGGGERGEVSFIFGVTRLNLRERRRKAREKRKREKKRKERKKGKKKKGRFDPTQILF